MRFGPLSKLVQEVLPQSYTTVIRSSRPVARTPSPLRDPSRNYPHHALSGCCVTEIAPADKRHRAGDTGQSIPDGGEWSRPSRGTIETPCTTSY